ncbi:MAG: tRNA pseudouridine(38-40) synthase TruA [Acidimicrobiales bacterium]|nr:tRNA pseudouridine(38-40) synthase TruA [Acidimicrobiales bacterium]
MTRVRLAIAYNGAGFRGLAPNAGVRTVIGELTPVLEAILGPISEIHMSGRTDAGVHARHQVLSFDTDTTIDATRLAKSINSRLGPEVIATSVDVAPGSFHARFSAIGRRYRYTVLNHPHPSPFSAGFEWWVPGPLDLEAMQAACAPVVGEHDFASFCRRPKPNDDGQLISLVRRVDSAAWSEDTDDSGQRRLRFEIAGAAFCHQMVRSITGLHVAVGQGRRSPADVADVLAARDRNAAPSPAPPQGLMLWDVMY